jgi:mannose-6-phosphate isomerase-like protein (cupin superfamily)
VTQAPPHPKAPAERFTFDELRAKAPPKAYQEFLRVRTMSAGVYRLPAGAVDPQAPHREDEVYVVLRGRATLEVDGRPMAAAPGSFLFVPAGAKHRFVKIEEDLEVLVFFAPAESLKA